MAEPLINATECYECGEIQEDSAYESEHPGDPSPECETCGGNTQWIRVSPCPISNPKECQDDEHHFGINKHVIEV